MPRTRQSWREDNTFKYVPFLPPRLSCFQSSGRWDFSMDRLVAWSQAGSMTPTNPTAPTRFSLFTKQILLNGLKTTHSNFRRIFIYKERWAAVVRGKQRTSQIFEGFMLSIRIRVFKLNPDPICGNWTFFENWFRIRNPATLLMKCCGLLPILEFPSVAP